MGQVQWIAEAPSSRVAWLGAPTSRVGDLYCPNVDIDQFKQNFRAPVYPEKWNVWLLRRTLRDNPSADAMQSTTEAVFDQWFKFSNYYGSVDIVNVLSISPNPAELAKLTPVRSATQLGVPGNVVQPGTMVLVKFAYRGSLTDMPWAAWKYSFGQFFNNWCPVDADWLLDTVYEPLKDPVPKEMPWWEKILPNPPSPGTWPDWIKNMGYIALGLGVLYVASQLVAKLPAMPSLPARPSATPAPQPSVGDV
jgi:hypothetical protein